jgi:cytochrome c oxidase subunit 2
MMEWLLPLAHAHVSNFMPVEGTKIAGDVDAIYTFLMVTSLISFIMLIGGMIYFVMKYKRRSGTDSVPYISHNHTLEFLWSFIPFLIFMFVFAWGWLVYHDMRKMPENGLEVQVYAKKWDWRFVYKSGKEVTSGVGANNSRTPSTLVVPLGQPVKLIMASEQMSPGNKDRTDRPVLHSFYIPAFRIKQDVVPGRYTALWFEPDKVGEFNVFCAEYCGAGHSAMHAMIKVVPKEEFQEWLAANESEAGTPAAQGAKLFNAKACAGCHSLDGSRIVGPTFKGLFGRVEKLEGGGTVTVDENYIRESILTPAAKVVATYPAGTMPTFAGQLSEQEINALIEFIETVK